MGTQVQPDLCRERSGSGRRRVRREDEIGAKVALRAGTALALGNQVNRGARSYQRAAGPRTVVHKQLSKARTGLAYSRETQSLPCEARIVERLRDTYSGRPRTGESMARSSTATHEPLKSIGGTMSDVETLRDLRKEGRVAEAYALGRRLVREAPSDKWTAQSFGWVLYDQLKAAAARAEQNPYRALEEASRIVDEFRGLSLIGPDLLRSRMLGQLRLIKGASHLVFRVTGPDLNLAFLPEDFRRREWKGKLYASLVERLALAVGKEAEAGDDELLSALALNLVDLAIHRCQLDESKWLIYRKGQLLGRLGRTSEAREVLIPFVRRSQREYWAWQALGGLYEAENPETALALFSRSWLECTKPEFRLKVEEAIGRTALQVGDLPLAKWALSLAVTTRREKGYNLSPSLVELVEQPWYHSVSPASSPKETLERNAESAVAILASDATWIDACVIETFTSKSGKQMVKLALRTGGKALGAVVSLPRAQPGTFALGQKARALATVEDGEATVHSIKAVSEDGQDVLDTMVGVVKHHRSERGFTSLYLPGDEFTLLDHTMFPSAAMLEVGTPVSVKTYWDRGRIKTVSYGEAKVPNTEWIRPVSGRVSMRDEGYGFLEDAFVPPDIAARLNFDKEVTLIAIWTLDKKKGRLSYRAVGLAPNN